MRWLSPILLLLQLTGCVAYASPVPIATPMAGPMASKREPGMALRLRLLDEVTERAVTGDVMWLAEDGEARMWTDVQEADVWVAGEGRGWLMVRVPGYVPQRLRVEIGAVAREAMVLRVWLRRADGWGMREL